MAQRTNRPESGGPWMHQGRAGKRQTLRGYLEAALGQAGPTAVRSLVAHGAVLVNRAPAKSTGLMLGPGDLVEVLGRKASKAGAILSGRKIRLVYEDEFFLVADKPAGLLTSAPPGTASDTLYALLNQYVAARHGRGSRVFALHRLDQKTSGLVLFPKSESVRDAFQDGWSRVRKEYLAVVEGQMKPPSGTLATYLEESASLKMSCGPPRPGARKAVLEYSVERAGQGRSLLRVVLHTGRKNQIRVQLAGAGHPVVGDAKYGSTQNPARRMALHAHRLDFTHPETGQEMSLESPFPLELSRLVPDKARPAPDHPPA